MTELVIRRASAEDDPALLRVIRQVRREFGKQEFEPLDVQAEGAYTPKHDGRARSFVAEAAGCVVGGAGLWPLPGAPETVCELRRMYLLAEFRGRGAGKRLLDACLAAARELGYERCYLETVAEMDAAIGLYERNGFVRIPRPLGATGHSWCDRFFVKELAPGPG